MRNSFGLVLDTDHLPEEVLNSHLHQYISVIIKALPNDHYAATTKQLFDALNTALLKGEIPEKLARRIRREHSRREVTLTSMDRENAARQVAEIKRLRQITRAKPSVPGSGKIDKYRSEIEMLRQAGASQMDIKYWLAGKKQVTVSQQTIHRYLKFLETERNA